MIIRWGSYSDVLLSCPKNVFSLLWFRKNIFTGYGVLDCHLIFVKAAKIKFHFLLAAHFDCWEVSGWSAILFKGFSGNSILLLWCIIISLLCVLTGFYFHWFWLWSIGCFWTGELELVFLRICLGNCYSLYPNIAFLLDLSSLSWDCLLIADRIFSLWCACF